MRNPLRTERRAFVFVPVVGIAALAVVVTHAVGSTAAVVAVSAVAVVAIVVAYLLGGGRPHGIPAAPGHVGPRSKRRTLLLVEGTPPRESLTALREADSVLVVSLASPSPLRRWFSDLDGARTRARSGLEETVSALRDLHVEADGVVGDDPFEAIDDALRTFGGDEIVVAADDHELTRSLRDRYALPVATVDPR